MKSKRRLSRKSLIERILIFVAVLVVLMSLAFILLFSSKFVPAPTSTAINFSPFIISAQTCNASGLYMYLGNGFGRNVTLEFANISNESGIMHIETLTDDFLTSPYNDTLPNGGAAAVVFNPISPGISVCGQSGVPYSASICLFVRVYESGFIEPVPKTVCGHIAGSSS